MSERGDGELLVFGYITLPDCESTHTETEIGGTENQIFFALAFHKKVLFIQHQEKSKV